MVQSPWLKTDPQQNFHQIALNNMNNSLLQPNILNGLPQRYVLMFYYPMRAFFFQKIEPFGATKWRKHVPAVALTTTFGH